MDIEERMRMLKEKHPQWSDEQIKSAIAIELSAGNVVDKAGKDASPEDPDIVRAVLEGAKEWLHEVLPEVFVKVAAFFDNGAVFPHEGKTGTTNFLSRCWRGYKTCNIKTISIDS